MACELPVASGVPLSRWSSAELAREAIGRGIVEQISGVTVWRWLSQDAIKPWQHRSWIFPRDPLFAERAGPILDLYAGCWQGERLHPGDYVVCADEKPSIQARKRIAATRPARRGEGQKVEHEYERKGALCYLAAWDARRAQDLRPLRPQGRHRAVRRARRPVHVPAPLHGPARLPDRRQRLRAPRQTLDRPPPRRLAQPDRRAHPDPRQLAQPGRDLLLRRPTQGRHPQRLPRPRHLEQHLLAFGRRYEQIARPSNGSSPATTSTSS